MPPLNHAAAQPAISSETPNRASADAGRKVAQAGQPLQPDLRHLAANPSAAAPVNHLGPVRILTSWGEGDGEGNG